MQKFKDACDVCGKFDFCKGVEGKVLCSACLALVKKNND